MGKNRGIGADVGAGIAGPLSAKFKVATFKQCVRSNLSSRAAGTLFGDCNTRRGISVWEPFLAFSSEACGKRGTVCEANGG